MRTLFRFSPVLFVVVAACDGVPPAATGVVSTTLQTRVAHVLPRGGASTVSFRTLPNAVCRLRIGGEPFDAQRQLRLYSDDQGLARVHLQHVISEPDHGQLLVDCADESGAQASHVIDVDIRAGADSTPPADYERAGKPTLPVLDVDPMLLSDQELRARQYPPRPDPDREPQQFSDWLELVTSAPTLITPHLIPDDERTHGVSARTSPNWSGYVINTASTAAKYVWIYGDWKVPRAYSESSFSSWDHSTLWVGIDGWNMADVVQDGTDQDTLTAFWVQTSSYDGWIEWFPYSSTTISNFPVNPGDEVRFWTVMLDSNGNYSNTPTVGWFYLFNKTQNVSLYTTSGPPSGITFNGHCAEWVMERPTVNGSYSSLAQYASPTSLTGALAYDLNGGSHTYTSDNSLQVTMKNGTDVLSTVKPVDASTMAFTWINHQ
jgi:hypothetical protein